MEVHRGARTMCNTETSKMIRRTDPVILYTAKPNISCTWGEKPAGLTSIQILQADSTDYLLGGSLTLRNGRIDKYLFEGGYAQASAAGATTDDFTFYYYNQDHLGNNREVVDASGTVQQVMNYYPFGMPYSDQAGTLNSDFQPYQYNGKELDKMHGLYTYDYGARQYDPVLVCWDRIDPLAEEYKGISPYVYCANNPVRFIDPDGKKIYIPKKSQSEVLHMINTYSKTQYKLDKNGFLCIDKEAELNEKGSAHYSERLDATILAKGKLTIEVGDKYTAKGIKNTKIYDVNNMGGGLTDKTDKKNVKTIVSANGHIAHDTMGNEVKKSAAEVLIHEIVGHAAPVLVGTETGNAVRNENIVRNELGLQEREDEKNHNE